MELCEAIGRMRAVADGPMLAGADADALRMLLSAVTRVTTLVACVKCGSGVRWRYSIKGLCPDCAAAEIDRLAAEDARLREAYAREDEETCQVLGLALGYPSYADDPANFPDATPADGVCVGPHVAVTLAMEAAERIARLAAGRDMAIARQVRHDGPEAEDPGRCLKCGEPFELVRPGKSQPMCMCWGRDI